LYIEKTFKRKNFVNLKPTEEFLNTHLYEPNKWKDGTDKAKMKNILWWWCDALFMAPPVITLYAQHTGNEKYLDDMHTYYMETYNQLYDKEEHLFARDMRYLWDVNEKDIKEPNGKKIFWSRGNGWVIGGLAMVGWVQNIGASPEPANANSWQNFGTGAYLLAGSEILKLD